MLSLSPRYDLFRFTLPKTFLPKEIEEKYTALINVDPGVLTTAIDYLNESVTGVTIPGISDITIEQQQHGTNGLKGLGKLGVEPAHSITYNNSDNPLEHIDKEFKVTFRMNQGLYNYFMIYETIFYRICKPLLYKPDPVLYIDILNGDGVAISRIKFQDVYLQGIDGIDFNFSKIDREAGTFDVTFKFNNIDFDFITN